MLNDEASSLRISSSPVHRRVSKPNLADVNPPLSLIARCFTTSKQWLAAVITPGVTAAKILVVMQEIRIRLACHISADIVSSCH